MVLRWKRLLGVIFAGGVALATQGATYYLKSGMTDLSVAGSYTLDEAGSTPATTPPGAADEVVVPAGTFAFSGSSASFATLSGVKRVRPNSGAVLEITIADDDTRTFEAPINWDAEKDTFNHEDKIHCYGTVVKKGAGTLILASSGNTKIGSTYQDYFTSFDLQAGTLKMPQHALGAMYYGDVTMAEGTKLVTTGDIDSASKPTFTYLRALNGYGTVTNETARDGQVCTVFGRELVYASEFHGRFCYPVKHWLPGRFKQYGDSVGFTAAVVVENNKGHLQDGYDRGCYEFENVALLGPSSIIEPYNEGAGFHYFGGEDGTIAKTVTLYTRKYPMFFDAGWHGGLTFTGNWNVLADSLNLAVSKWVVLMGSNAVPCTITGGFSENAYLDKEYESPDKVPYTIFVEKQGSGAWRFAGSRSHGGGFAIKEGALQFESIAEKGESSSLGRSTNLTSACSERDVSPYRVPYAFALGTTAAAPAAPAAFEFVGSKSSGSTTRPLVLVGSGGAIRASGTATARLGFGDVSALAAGETTLVIDGTNTFFNTISGVKDGAGRVNVVKAGSGEWYLSCSNTFTGDLAVNAGTLTVLGPKYTWFRFTVKQSGNQKNQLNFRQVALYDAAGIRQNICLKVTPSPVNNSSTVFWPDSDGTGLAPGSFAFGSKTFRLKGPPNQYIDQLFSDVGNTTSAGITRFDGEISYGNSCSIQAMTTTGSGSEQNIRPDTPSTWIPFVMRLTNGAPEIVSYDIEGWYDTRGTNVWPRIATMEASIDGVKWDLVETNALGEVVAEHDYDFTMPLWKGTPTEGYGSANCWFSDGKGQVNWSPTKGTTPRPGAGFPMRSRADYLPMPLQNVRSVSVASGATLRTQTPVMISSLKVNAAGAGTMDGFTFAENGTLNVTAESFADSIDLPGTYVNCTGLGNIAGWSLELNGVSSRKFKPVVVNGQIRLLLHGFTVTIR